MGGGGGALGCVICDLHGRGLVSVHTGLVESTANTCLYSAPGEGSTGREYRSSCLCCATLDQ